MTQPSAAVHYNLGCALQARQDLSGAIAAYDAALALDGRFAAAHSNRGAALVALNRCEEALASLDTAIDLNPDYAEAHFCRAIAWLMQGNLAAGWAEFEWRWQTAPGRALRQAKQRPQPLWRGEPPAGKTLLLYSERGLGDTLQFCRYATRLVEQGARVILQVQDALVPLLRRLPGVMQVLGETAQGMPPIDWQCPLLSLPWITGTTWDTLPAPRRYLAAEAARTAYVRTRWAAAGGGARVGVAWRGDAANPDDGLRSLTLTQLLSALPPAFEYVSLQREVGAEEQEMIGAHRAFSVLAQRLDFEATAALCECVDLVIAVDTSIAHLAAALGRPTWILLPFSADCRWLREREDSPWYPTARLYRQAVRGAWDPVLRRVAQDLVRGRPF